MVTSISLDHHHHHHHQPTNNNHHNHGVVVEEIQGLIKVYSDGHVERFPIVPIVTPEVPPELCITSRDVIIHRPTNTWARLYVPTQQRAKKLPLVMYFHGGGFCVGSAAWKCYHDFLAVLASKSRCVIISVNYRLSPENRLPAAYDDGISAVSWVKQQALMGGSSEHQWWLNMSELSSFFLAGDSAGANIAHHVATRVVTAQNRANLPPLRLKGIVLIQPFLGGETRSYSEKHLTQAYNSALSLSVSDAYWRLSLPLGANRDHPWCNPLARTAPTLTQLPPLMVCISEMDIMIDRNLEFCAALASSGVKVEKMKYKGVGHAFQILHNYPLSQQRTLEMMSHLMGFFHS